MYSLCLRSFGLAALCWSVGAAESSTTTSTTTVIHYYYDRVATLPDLKGKCVAITGTTSGLGYWTARATVQKKASCLIMINRPSSRADVAQQNISALAGEGVDVMTVHADLQSLSSVRAAAKEVNTIVGKYGGLDVLALNAGIMDQPDTRTVDGLPVDMQTNHEAQFLLTKLLMPALEKAASAGREVRIATQTSLERGRGQFRLGLFTGGGPQKDKYFLRSAPGTLGGDKGKTERYHQSKRANLLFAMALHNKFASNPERYKSFRAVSATPGFSATKLNIPEAFKAIEKSVALSAPDGACSLLTVMFDPAVKSGDFYEPKKLVNGPPAKIISQGVALPADLVRLTTGIEDKQESCNVQLQDQMWNATEVGLGEKFTIESETVHQVLV